jgi:hypothetical protein
MSREPEFLVAAGAAGNSPWVPAETTTNAMKEWLGLLVYKMRGYL